MNKWKNLIFTHCIKEILPLFNSLFLGIYFLKITEGNLTTIALYYLIYYLSHVTCRYIVSKFINSSRVIKMYRMGLLTTLIISLILLFSRENIVNFIYLFAIIYAFSQCLYWSSYEVIIDNLNHKNNFNKYFTYDSVINNITSVVFPIIFGNVIEGYSYQLVFLILVGITIVSFILSFTIKDVKIDCEKIQPKKSIKTIKDKKLFKLMSFQAVCDGLTNGGVISLLATLILYNNVKSEGIIGNLSSVIALICIFAAIVVEKKVNYKNYKKIVLPLVTMMFLITIPISLKSSAILIAIYQLLIALGNVLTNIEGNALVFKGINYILDAKYKVDYYWFIELFLNIGRAIGIIMILLLFNIFKDINSLIILFIFFSAFYIVRALVIIALQKKIKRE